MTVDSQIRLGPSRRSLLRTGLGLALAAASTARPSLVRAAPRRITAGTGQAPLVGPDYPATSVWCYDGQVPGPAIRLRQGDRLRIEVVNGLPEATTIHWHGVRLPNAMDGVPNLTQAPIRPGESFTYEFDLPDAGTYWYHPHQRSAEQVGRGLYGPLIVEEPEAIRVDREKTWVLDDWRLRADAAISPDFGSFMDISHGGRLGNTVTVNGRIPATVAVRTGERLRLRLVNAANARIFGLAFEGHSPRIIALDGHPVEPHEPPGGLVVLGPAMRADLVLDMEGSPGGRFAVTDEFYRGREYRLLDLVYAGGPPLREHPLDAPDQLPANPLAEPDLNAAERHEIVFGGGMMGDLTGATMEGQPVDPREMMRQGMAWTINGVVATEHSLEPLLTLRRGRSYRFAMRNYTAWHHPIHLHGHAFRVIARDGVPTRYREWRDTVLMNPRESVEIAFVADNPGDWMLHCHILEHQAGGMMGVVRVT